METQVGTVTKGDTDKYEVFRSRRLFIPSVSRRSLTSVSFFKCSINSLVKAFVDQQEMITDQSLSNIL